MRPRFIASFDSASAMVRALGRFLRGEDFPRLAMLPPGIEAIAPAVNALPRGVKEAIYTWSGWSEAIAQEEVARVRAEAISRWVVSEYPRRRYPAAMVGSSSGAAVHLCAALGIPWLPQTVFIPVRQAGVHPDEPRLGLEAGREAGRALLAANPDLQLHHMHDPVQDRLMIRHMTYFRVKRLRLGDTYEEFLADTLPSGGTLYLLECRQPWPTTRVGERHIFQFGAVGGATPDEYLHGSPSVADYLRRYGSHHRRWDPPPPDGERPEAEWGFAEALREDAERLARRRGYRLCRVVFDHPEDLSPLVADLYRWWYRRLGIPDRRLLVESFILLEPWWTLRGGWVPLWSVFPVAPSAARVERYLDEAGPFDEIGVTLFSHGVDSAGLAPIPRWRAILDRAERRGSFVGVDPGAFPRDFAVFVRFHHDLSRLEPRYPLPEPLALADLEAFLREMGDRYSVAWRAAAPVAG